MVTGDKPLIFISYSSFDTEAKGLLERHLGVLKNLGDFHVWEDGQIGLGDDWFQEIQDKLETCAVAVLLISHDFLSSKFCMKEEVPVLLERRKRDGMMIAPILLGPCAWKIVPWLAAIQMFPQKAKPLRGLSDYEQAEKLTDVVEAVHAHLEERKARDAQASTEKADAQPQIEAKLDTPYPALPDKAIDLTRLPTSGFDVVGRDKEIQLLNEAFDGTQLNVVSLRAWGGVGKSTLVNKWCEYLAADNYRGARRVFSWSFYSQGTGNGQSGSEHVTSADAFIDEALRFFGDHDPTAGSPWSKGERLAELVGKEKALLILDGMEPLQDRHQGIKDPALARLVECLAEKNAGLCVITTREPVKEFSDFPETTQEIDLEHLSKEAGRALLRIKGLRASDDLIEQTSEAFGNHALALNLLASFLRLTRRSIQDALKIPSLSDVTVDAGKHPRRVMAAFADYFGEGPELDLLHIMGLFDRPADAGCIAALRGSAIPGLTEKLSTLDEKSWQNLLAKLRRLGLLAEGSHHAPDDLDAHPLVREHFGARMRAKQEGAWKAGHERLYEYLKTIPAKHEPDTLAEMAPLFQAVHHGCQSDRGREALRDIYYSRILRKRRNYLVKKLGAFGADLGMSSCFFQDPWHRPSTDLDDEDQFWLLSHTGFLLHTLGRLQDALLPTQAGLAGRIEKNNWRPASIAVRNLCQLEVILGNVEKSEHLAISAVSFADQSGVDLERMRSRSVLAHIKHQRGKIETALNLFEDACLIQENIESYKDPILLSIQGYQHCDLLINIGKNEDVLKRATYSLEISRRNDWPFSIALSKLCLGRVAIAQSKIHSGKALLDQAIDSLRTLGGPEYVSKSLLARAASLREVMECSLPCRDLDEAMRIAVRCGMRLHECDAHLEYARLALAESKHDDAVVHFKSAQQLVTACGYHRRDPEIAALRAALNQ